MRLHAWGPCFPAPDYPTRLIAQRQLDLGTPGSRLLTAVLAQLPPPAPSPAGVGGPATAKASGKQFAQFGPNFALSTQNANAAGVSAGACHCPAPAAWRRCSPASVPCPSRLLLPPASVLCTSSLWLPPSIYAVAPVVQGNSAAANVNGVAAAAKNAVAAEGEGAWGLGCRPSEGGAASWGPGCAEPGSGRAWLCGGWGCAGGGGVFMWLSHPSPDWGSGWLRVDRDNAAGGRNRGGAWNLSAACAPALDRVAGG